MPDPNPEETNTEFVERIMTFSKNGGMMQLVVMIALERMYRDGINKPNEVLGESGGANFIHTDAFVRTCKELRMELLKKSGGWKMLVYQFRQNVGQRLEERHQLPLEKLGDVGRYIEDAVEQMKTPDSFVDWLENRYDFSKL